MAEPKYGERVDRLAWWSQLERDRRVQKTLHYVALQMSTYGNGPLFPSMARLANATGLTPQAIRTHRKELVRLGYLIRVGGGHNGATAIYHMTLPELPLEEATVVAPSGERGKPQPQRGKREITKGPPPLPPKSINPLEEEQPSSEETNSVGIHAPTGSAQVAEPPCVGEQASVLARCLAARPARASTGGWTNSAVTKALAEALAFGISERDADGVLLVNAGRILTP